MADAANVTRRQLLVWLVPACGGCLGAAPGPEGLEVRWRKDRIRVAAPELHFVSGKQLEKLHNGAPVPYAFQLSLSTDRWSSTLLRDIERFVLSYDLWEEKFSVTKLGSPRRSASQLGARAAEAWCIDEMALDSAGVGDQQPFWLRLEIRADAPGELPPAGEGGEGATLTRLVELFSRRARREQSHWELSAGPMRLAELRRYPEVRR